MRVGQAKSWALLRAIRAPNQLFVPAGFGRNNISKQGQEKDLGVHLGVYQFFGDRNTRKNQ
jgi:hypothetical protein